MECRSRVFISAQLQPLLNCDQGFSLFQGARPMGFLRIEVSISILPPMKLEVEPFCKGNHPFEGIRIPLKHDLLSQWTLK